MGNSDTKSNMHIVDAWRERVWAQQDASAIDELFEDDGIAGGLGRKKLAGPPEFRQFHAAICALIDDIRLEIIDYIEQGDKLACLCTFGGTCRKTGNAIKMDGSMYYEFRNGKILHCENHFEFMDFYEQLNLMPSDSFAVALSGQKVA